MKKDYQLKIIFSLFILGIILISTGATVFLTKQKDVKLPIFAGESCSGGPDDSQGCTNGGDLRNGCNWICNNEAPAGTVLNPPSCCENLAKTGDPFACCFDARRRCTPSQCSSIPEGTAKQRCGQLWELGGYCSGSSNNTPSPVPTARPTNILQPTTPPTPEIPIPTEPPPPPLTQPTTVPTKQPQSLQPPPIDFNVQQNANRSGQNQKELQNPIELPKITFPKLNFSLPKIDTDKIQIGAAKPLGFFEYVFARIIYYDKQLEDFINSKISSINL